MPASHSDIMRAASAIAWRGFATRTWRLMHSLTFMKLSFVE